MKWIPEYFNKLLDPDVRKQYDCETCKYSDENPEWQNEKRRAYMCKKRCGSGFKDKWKGAKKSFKFKEYLLSIVDECAMELEGGGKPYVPQGLRYAVGLYRKQLDRFNYTVAVREGYLRAHNKIVEAQNKAKRK